MAGYVLVDLHAVNRASTTMKVAKTYEARAEQHSSEVAKSLLTVMAQKQTNLCVSVDVTTKAALLRLVDAVGPFCCLIKVHFQVFYEI